MQFVEKYIHFFLQRFESTGGVINPHSCIFQIKDCINQGSRRGGHFVLIQGLNLYVIIGVPAGNMLFRVFLTAIDDFAVIYYIVLDTVAMGAAPKKIIPIKF